jgi:hypothetical protein
MEVINMPDRIQRPGDTPGQASRTHLRAANQPAPALQPAATAQAAGLPPVAVEADVLAKLISKIKKM